jgi:hypothetical protein
MSENTKPTYVGRIEKKETQYGEIIKVGLNEEHIETLKNSINDRGWVNLVIKSRDGKSWMQIDTYKPKE